MQRRSSTQRRSVANASRALEHYDHDSVQLAVVDLITDIKHLSDFYGFDFYELCDRAHGHYSAEVCDARVTTE